MLSENHRAISIYRPRSLLSDMLHSVFNEIQVFSDRNYYDYGRFAPMHI